ncbi:AAA family ATPase [Escherichia coli]|nr:AAA family ATPase [Escherichia coli]
MMSKIKLTDKQQEIFDNFVDRVYNYAGKTISVLSAPAGTGKTFTTAEIVKALCKNYNIAVTSPTHKANSVIRNMLINNAGLTKEDAQVSTIHSFLGLKLVYEKNRQVLKHDPQSKVSNTNVDILIVDECSMISEELFQHIQDQLWRVRRAVLFIGDRCQLPPVESEGTIGETKLSPTFDVPVQYELTEVLRQALDNPILAIATAIRECIGTSKNPFDIMHQTHGLSTITPIEDEDLFLEVYREFIMENKGSAKKIFDFVNENKILAYTNYRVNLANIYIRSQLFEVPDEFTKGEPIVFESITENSPYVVQQIIQCPDVKTESFMGIDCWQFRLPNGSYILGVGPETRIAMEAKLDELVKNIEKKEINPLTKKPYMWQDYYVIKNKLHIINYPYATTVHKSQGSTFDNIWFDTDFIERIGTNDTKCRILYTAMTRPRYNVMLRQNARF